MSHDSGDGDSYASGGDGTTKKPSTRIMTARILSTSVPRKVKNRNQFMAYRPAQRHAMSIVHLGQAVLSPMKASIAHYRAQKYIPPVLKGSPCGFRV